MKALVRLYNYLDLLYSIIVISNNNRVLLLTLLRIFAKQNYCVNYIARQRIIVR